MIDRGTEMSIVSRTALRTVHFDGKTIHVDGRAEDAPLRSRGEHVTADGFEQAVANLLAVLLLSKNGNEA